MTDQGHANLLAYEHAYPGIHWRQPVTVNVSGVIVLECRVCIGKRGLKGTEVISGVRGFPDFEAFAAHMRDHHNVEAEPPTGAEAD